MSTAIEWTDETWNPVVGCSRVSAGCRNCYAFDLHNMRRAALHAGKKVPEQYRRPFDVIQIPHERVTIPLGWKRPRRVFVNSMSDLFHKDVPYWHLLRVFGAMMLAKQHTFQVLTKRPERALEFLSRKKIDFDIMSAALALQAPRGNLTGGISWTWPLPNVWLGVSVEDQWAADERIPLLLKTPAAVRFLSCEPLLGPVTLWQEADGTLKGPGVVEDGGVTADSPDFPPEGYDASYPGLDWVIVGGESGAGARPMHPDWARSLRDQCQAAAVPFFFKQWGEWAPHHMASLKPVEGVVLESGIPPNRTGTMMMRWGKKAAGRRLDGREWNEFPRDRRCKCFADRGLLMTARCTLHGEAED